MSKLNDILQERYGLVKKAEAIQLKATAEKRDFTAEEKKQYDAIFADVDAMKAKVDEAQADEERSKKLTNALENMEKPLRKGIIEDIGTEDRKGKFDSPEYRKAFNHYLSATDASAELQAKMELRALQMDLGTAGGYTVLPQLFVAELIEAMKATTFFRSIAKVYSVPNAESLGQPALDARPADPVWTQEIAIGDEDSTMKFAKREMHPHPLAKLLKMSKKLIRASALNVDQVVRDQLAYKIAITEENCFLNGTGTGQPLGVFVNSPLGISSTYDISTGNTTTAITADGLIEAKYALRPPYWPRAKWIFHPSAIKNIRKLRGNDGDFLWKSGLSNDKGDTLLDCPILVSEFAPSTFTTGLYVGIIGVFDFYEIADALDVTIQVLTELYAATNQNGYIIRKETDGMPVLGEAFIRVTLA
jgi:HK97 family phage major capsid protein